MTCLTDTEKALRSSLVICDSHVHKHDFIGSAEEMNLISETVWSNRHSGYVDTLLITRSEPLARSHEPLGIEVFSL